MKITTTQLRQLIKEEIGENFINEFIFMKTRQEDAKDRINDMIIFLKST